MPPFSPELVASNPLPINKPAFGWAAVPLLMNTPISEVIGLALGVRAGVASAAFSLGGVEPPVSAHSGSPPHAGDSTDVNCTTPVTVGGGVSVVAASQNPTPATASPAVTHGATAVAMATPLSFHDQGLSKA